MISSTLRQKQGVDATHNSRYKAPMIRALYSLTVIAIFATFASTATAEERVPPLTKMVLGEQGDVPSATLARFNRLDAWEQQELLQEAGDGYITYLANLRVVFLRDKAAINEIYTRNYKSFFKKIYPRIEGGADKEEIHQSDFGFIEQAEIDGVYIVVADKSGEILGAGAQSFIQGFERNNDDSEWTYPTVNAAERAGVDASQDIGWSANVFFGPDADHLDTDNYYEWSGW